MLKPSIIAIIFCADIPYSMQRIVLVVGLLCVAVLMSKAFNCNTDTGRLAYLKNGTKTNPNCFNPIVDLLFSGKLQLPAEIQAVSEALSISQQLRIEVCVICLDMPR